MERRTLAALAAFALAGCGALPFGGSQQTLVGHDDPRVDVAAVQAAVDRGGDVTLQGRFDFGETGSVNITRDVAIHSASGTRALIKGGQAALRSLPPLAGDSRPAPRIEIRDLDFEGATWIAIQAGYGHDIVLSGNRISHVKPVDWTPDAFSKNQPYKRQHGIVVGLAQRGPRIPADYIPGAVTGTLRIEGNDIEATNDAPTRTMGIALWVLYTTGIDAEVARNKVRGASRNAIEMIDNYRNAEGRGGIHIHDNDIEAPAEGALIPGPGTPNGMVVGYFIARDAANDPKRAADISVVHNTIHTHCQTPPGGGGCVAVSLLANGAVVKDNQVTLSTPFGAGIYIAGARNKVSGNRVDGSGGAAIFFAGPPMGPATDNEVTGNEFGALKATYGHVVLMKGSARNHVSGSGTFRDGGEGNLIEGLQAVASPPAK